MKEDEKKQILKDAVETFGIKNQPQNPNHHMTEYNYITNPTVPYYYVLDVHNYRAFKTDQIQRPSEFRMIFDNSTDAQDMEAALLIRHHITLGQSTIIRQMAQQSLPLEEYANFPVKNHGNN